MDSLREVVARHLFTFFCFCLFSVLSHAETQNKLVVENVYFNDQGQLFFGVRPIVSLISTSAPEGTKLELLPGKMTDYTPPSGTCTLGGDELRFKVTSDLQQNLVKLVNAKHKNAYITVEYTAIDGSSACDKGANFATVTSITVE